MSVFRKHDDGPVSTALEAQGLTWLAEAMADGGAHVVPVTSGPGWLEEPRLTTTGVTPAGAEAFGRALAVTHAAGAPAFGAAPPGWDGRAQMGRSDIRLQPHAAEEGEPRRWGEFYAEDRILPYLQ
ncbi:MAG: fructosamine kinase, partial [Cardiobacterium hominis]